MPTEQVFIRDDFLTISPGEPFRLFPFGTLVKGGKKRNITPEFASPLGNRSVAQRAKSAVVSSLADAILIAGPMAGAEPDFALVAEARVAVGPDVPVLLNTGARVDNIAKFLSVADGVIVGSSLKEEGDTWNPVDPSRVRAFMDEVRNIRKGL